jgi:hypothetical protein
MGCICVKPFVAQPHVLCKPQAKLGVKSLLRMRVYQSIDLDAGRVSRLAGGGFSMTELDRNLSHLGSRWMILIVGCWKSNDGNCCT